MNLQLGHVSLDEFQSTYWRRRPLFIPGGARLFLENPLEPAQFLSACDRMLPGLVFRKGDELAFGQRVDLADESLHRVCKRFAAWLSGVHVWFDGVYAREGMGIGSHFDFSDGFVLQQRGTKLWRLHGPEHIPDESIRRRLLNELEFDAMYMPDGALEFRLEEGDALYLPLLWAHWGVSEGESLSVSLTFTSRLGLDCLDTELLTVPTGVGERGVAHTRDALWRACYPRPAPTQVPARSLPLHIRTTLAHDRTWWQPLPVIWSVEGNEDVEGTTRVQAERHVDALAASLPALAAAWQKLPPQEVAALPLPRWYRARTPVQPGPPLPGLDDLLSAASALPDPKVDPTCLGAPELAVREADRLRLRVARRCLGRFLRIVQRCHEWILRDELKRALHTLMRGFARVPAAVLAEALRHPALRGWSWRATEVIQSGYVPRLEELVAQLPRLLLPALLDADALAPGESLPVIRGTARSLPLLAWGAELRSDEVLPEVLEVRRDRDSLMLGTTLRLAPAESGQPWRALEGRLAPFARAWPAGPPVCGDDDWIHGFFPAGQRAGGLALVRADAAPCGALAAALSAGHAHLLSHHAAWAAWIGPAFQLVVPRSECGEPPWQTARGFPGLLAPAVREPDATARSLINEAARQLAYDALDGLSLVEDMLREAFVAWSGQGASLSERIANAMSHALTLDVVAAPGPLAAEVQELREQSGLTAAGVALLDGLAQRVVERA